MTLPPPKDYEAWGAHFRASGAAEGDQLASFPLTDLSGRSVGLSELFTERPTVVVTGNTTCPVARSRVPDLARGLAPFGERVRRVLVYTSEAHPKGSAAPHAYGEEWVTPANEREGILHAQPQTLEERVALARIFEERWGGGFETYLDGMDDALFEHFGTAPCLALLVAADGRILAKQGWLDVDAMVAAVQRMLG